MSALWKHTLAYECGVHIWQVSPQLICDYTCQNWKWLNKSNRYFCKIENFTDGDFNERSFSNPHPITKQFSSILVCNNVLRIIPTVCAILCFWVVPYRVIYLRLFEWHWSSASETTITVDSKYITGTQQNDDLATAKQNTKSCIFAGKCAQAW